MEQEEWGGLEAAGPEEGQGGEGPPCVHVRGAARLRDSPAGSGLQMGCKAAPTKPAEGGWMLGCVSRSVCVHGAHVPLCVGPCGGVDSGPVSEGAHMCARAVASVPVCAVCSQPPPGRACPLSHPSTGCSQAGVPLPGAASAVGGRGRAAGDSPSPGLWPGSGAGAVRPPPSNGCPLPGSPMLIPEPASVLLGPSLREGATPCSWGVRNWPFPASRGAQQTGPPPCPLPGRRLTHDLFIKSHYLCQRRRSCSLFKCR